MELVLNPNNIADYQRFLQIKSLPTYRIVGRRAWFPDEYASRIVGEAIARPRTTYRPSEFLFDYQRDIARLAINKQRFAVFADCGLGKSLIEFEFARHAAASLPGNRCVLMLTPLMVVSQMQEEYQRFYGEPLHRVKSSDLGEWLASGTEKIGITNWEALRDDDLQRGRLGGIVADESSLLKSHYGKFGQRVIDLGKGIEWKLAATGTPAPNDRIEYGNHAVFLDQFPNVNAFLAKYFVNRGQTDNRWEIKPHAIGPFYLALSHWCIFVSNPGVYGWKDNCESLPPIEVHIHDVDLTAAQKDATQSTTGELFTHRMGGIVSRSALGRIAKGYHKGEQIETRKPEFIRSLVESWPDESTIIWCLYNDEQDRIAKMLPEAANISGDTPQREREILLEWFKGRICTCERNRLIANTCKSIIEKTNTDGTSEPLKSRLPTTLLDEPNTPPAKKTGSRQGSQRSHGSSKTPQSDSLNVSGHTDLDTTNISSCSHRKMDAVPSAETKDRELSGRSECTLTIATQPASSVGCCAAIATTESESSKTIPSYSQRPQCTCEQGRPAGRILISKCKVLGFGLNLQIATRQIFSGLQDSYESYYQAVKRSNRYGSTKPLNVHIPVTEVEWPMIETVLRKAGRVNQDTEEQERLFSRHGKDILQCC